MKILISLRRMFGSLERREEQREEKRKQLLYYIYIYLYIKLITTISISNPSLQLFGTQKLVVNPPTAIGRVEGE